MAKPKQKNKVGRPRTNLEFKEARELVRNENIQSVAQYRRWWLLNTPAKIPKRPDRAYKNEWQGWNDFLGSNNPFPCVKRSFRPFKEARSYVQQLGFRNKDEYIAYAKTSKKPVDIPSRPDLIYRNDWFTWSDFIGANIASVKRNIATADAIFFVINNYGRPRNVFQFGITMDSVQDIKRAQQINKFKIISLSYCNLEFGWKDFAEEYGRQYWEAGRSDEYLIPNINDFLFQISDFVEFIRK